MSQSTLVAMLEDKLVSVAVSATRPSGGSDGVDITSWRTNGEFSTPLAAIFLDGSQAQTIADPTGGTIGVELWGYRLSQWWLIGFLNNGDDVAIAGASQGWATQIQVVGVFDRLAIAGTPSAGTTTAKLVPIQEWAP